MFRISSRRARRLVVSLGAAAFGLSLMLAAPLPRAQTGPDGAAEARVRAAMEQLTGGRTKVDEVRATPIPGVYEVRVGTRLLYVEGQGKYMFLDGDLIDLQSQRNLTQERVEELQTIDFGVLPLDLAIKQVNGKGKRVVAVFEDANCGYCKRLRADLVKLDDLTIYTFPLAFLAADSETKARKALCAADPARAWNELLLNNRVPDNAGTCQTPLKDVQTLAHKLGITGTPVVFFSNGRRLTGYAPPEQFGKMLAAHSKG
jgi:thiol:disulfide interchange protein DsbC